MPVRVPPDARGARPGRRRPGTAVTAPGAAGAEVRLLGPVEVHDHASRTAVSPPGPKQRSLLSALVLRHGRPLGVDRLVEELWGDRPPANAANALQAHVARLRRVLPRAPGTPAGREPIIMGPGGYLLVPDEMGTDVQRFRRLSAEGRAAVAADPENAVRVLRAALSLWRGPALQDSLRGPVCAGEADRLEEERLTLLESLYEASLRCARHAEVTGELEKLTADHPLRERFYDLLMVALHRCGRQGEALGVYERARRRLVQTLGVEPGPALRERLEAILRHAPPGPGPAGPCGRCDPCGSAVPDRLADLAAETARLRRRVDELSRRQDLPARRTDPAAVIPAPR
ncbi:AfsR/SARP family transcriptional regulator [Streptomyces sp. NPDC005012]|uniref:AfsR/SARP family transcriptional regulator n=1 Tax=Streptomyces sp. NPDC005012 TaxID=3154558 RepID=UPI0033B4E5EF